MRLTIQAFDASHVDGVVAQLKATRAQGYDVLGVQQALGAGELIEIVEGYALAVEPGLMCTKRLTL